jgi:hypothetical protein
MAGRLGGTRLCTGATPRPSVINGPPVRPPPPRRSTPCLRWGCGLSERPEMLVPTTPPCSQWLDAWRHGGTDAVLASSARASHNARRDCRVALPVACLRRMLHVTDGSPNCSAPCLGWRIPYRAFRIAYSTPRALPHSVQGAHCVRLLLSPPCLSITPTFGWGLRADERESSSSHTHKLPYAQTHTRPHAHTHEPKYAPPNGGRTASFGEGVFACLPTHRPIHARPLRSL